MTNLAIDIAFGCGLCWLVWLQVQLMRIILFPLVGGNAATSNIAPDPVAVAAINSMLSRSACHDPVGGQLAGAAVAVAPGSFGGNIIPFYRVRA